MEKKHVWFFQIFMNFVSSCARYVHEEPMCTEYALSLFFGAASKIDFNSKTTSLVLWESWISIKTIIFWYKIQKTNLNKIQ
jgi:hypothetical protein